MVEKLKRGNLVGKREGNSTPSPTWKFGLIQPDGTLIPDFNFPTNTTTLSARQLGANLWEMEPQLNLRVQKMSKHGPLFGHHKSEEKGFGIANDLTANSPLKQEISSIKLRKQIAESLTQPNARVENVGRAQQPLSPASYSSSMEIAPNGSVISPSSSYVSNAKLGESSHSLKTSTELLKVLNRIWSLEEKHALDMSLVKALRRELGQCEAHIQELMKEKKRDQHEIDNLMKQLSEHKIVRKKEQERIKDAVKLVEEKLEGELKLRRHSEKRHHKLAKELSEIKSSFSNALRELDCERKARILLEDLCDELAKGIRDYEQELRLMKRKTCRDQIEGEGNDRFILHISEAWLDERKQMKLADAHDVLEKQSALDKLCIEIESFLREKQSVKSPENQGISSKAPGEKNIPPESFHLKEPASAPWNVKDEDDSVGILNHSPQFRRGCSLNEMSNPRMPRKGKAIQRSSREGKDGVTDVDVDSEKVRDEYNCMEGSFDPSTFAGPPSPVKKWTSEMSAAGHDILELSLRCPKNVKHNTLKAKLMEARLDGQQSRTRTSESSSQVD